MQVWKQHSPERRKGRRWVKTARISIQLSILEAILETQNTIFLIEGHREIKVFGNFES